MSKKQKLGYVIFILSLIAFIGISIFLMVMLDIKRRDEAYLNPPDKVWLEEDLEEIFLTTQVNVIEIVDNGRGSLIVKVRIYDDGAYHIYRCLYEVKRYQLSYYTWELIRYV